MPKPLEPNAPHAADLAAIVAADPILAPALSIARALALPNWMVVSGAVYQTVWNTLTGRPPGHGIRDLDLVYFDATNVSWHAEDRVIRRAEAAFDGFPLPVEVRNQARVHLWFEWRFGVPYAPLGSAAEGLARYASVAHAVGIGLAVDGTLEIHAPFGLEDVFAMRLRPNRVLDNAASHHAKAERMAALWPELGVEPW